MPQIRKNFDIEGCIIRYRLSTISKMLRYWIQEIWYRCSTISKKLRYRSSLSSISTNAPSISGYDIEALCFDIDVCVLRYRCFFVGYCLGCCSSYSVLDTDCRVHRLLPVLPVLRTGCALAAHWLRTGSSTGRSRRSGAQTSRARLLVLAAGPSGAALGQAEYVKLNLVPGWPSLRLSISKVGKVPVAAFCAPQPWSESEQWEQPEFAWQRRLSYAR